MAQIILFSKKKLSPGGRTLYVQEGQVIQTPAHANVPVTLFFDSESDLLQLNTVYECDSYQYHSRKHNDYRTGYENFKLAEAQ